MGKTWEKYGKNWVTFQITDKKVARNINISFGNNANVPIDIMVFTIYADDFTIDVETGLLQK